MEDIAHLIPTNVAVLSKAQNILPDGGRELTPGSTACVTEAVKHYQRYEGLFAEQLERGRGGILVMMGGYPVLASGGRAEPTPYHLREGTQMYGLARDLGVPHRHLANSPASTSLLENFLRAKEEGHFTQVNRYNLLGIVAESTRDSQGNRQHTQFDRALIIAHHALQVPYDAIDPIPVQADLSAQEQADEQKLYKVADWLYRAETAAGLRRAERFVQYATGLLFKTGLQKAPLDHYATTAPQA